MCQCHVYHCLVIGWRRDDDGKIGWIFVKGGLRIGVTLFSGDTEMLLSVDMGGWVHIHRSHHLHSPILNVGG